MRNDNIKADTMILEFKNEKRINMFRYGAKEGLAY